jgi:hypothetical protein
MAISTITIDAEEAQLVQDAALAIQHAASHACNAARSAGIHLHYAAAAKTDSYRLLQFGAARDQVAHARRLLTEALADLDTLSVATGMDEQSA